MRPIVGAIALVLTAAPVMAQTATTPATITLLRTGWNADSFAVVTSAPRVGPLTCNSQPGYVSTKPAPGYDTLYRAALLAFEKNARVTVTVHNSECAPGGWPKIIGINLLP